MKAQYKRRCYFINKELQGKYILSYFLVIFIGTMVLIAGLWIFTGDSMSIVYDNYNLKLGSTPSIMSQKLLFVFWGYMVLGGIVIVIWSMLLTHRIAGPLFKIERYVETLRKGKLNGRIYLRKNDEGTELADSLNEFTQTLADDIAAIGCLSLEIKDKINDLSGVPADQSENEGPTLKNVAMLNNQVLDIVTKFSVEKK